MQERVLLPVRRYKQRTGECAIAAASSLAHYYDNDVNYKMMRQLVPEEHRSLGLYSSEWGRLMNKSGFHDVTIVTADLRIVDFSWAGLTKESLIEKLKQVRTHTRKKNRDLYECVRDLVKWLSDKKYNNNLVIDYEFKKHITKHLDKSRPVGAAVNWTSLFRFRKASDIGNADIAGSIEEHAVVIRGYDDKGVFIVDSHHQYYRGKREKFKKGYYKLPWDRFLVNIPAGDLIIV